MLKIMTRSFMIPQQEAELNELQNNPLYVVTKKELVTFPKEGIIYIIVDYEDYSNNDNTDDDLF